MTVTVRALLLVGGLLLAGARAPARAADETDDSAAGQTAGQEVSTEASDMPRDADGEGNHGLLAMFTRGGPLMWPILLCSVITVAFALERAAGTRRGRLFPRRLAAELRGLAREGKTAEALTRCETSRSPFATLVKACLLRAGNEGFEMEAALEEAGARVLYDLRRNCKPLSVVADVAPLLGLMGTVTGMIKAFDVVARSGALGRTELLAEGISEALLTTAFGLIVAVPAIILYHVYRAKAENLLREMEDACLEILTALRAARSVGKATETATA